MTGPCAASGIGYRWIVLSRRMASDQRGLRSPGGEPWVTAIAEGLGRNAGAMRLLGISDYHNEMFQ